MEFQIPFNKPCIVGKELHNIAEAVHMGSIAGDGPFTKRCSSFLETEYGIEHVLMTPSCTAALEMAAMLCELRAGDEVIMPAYTFVSTANAVVREGARPVFVDIRPDTLNIDESLIEAAITPATKAIYAVHYAGVACEMDRIMEIADRHGLVVVEDAAQGVNAFYKGRALGSLGHLGTFSFHETKNVICGEGGALCINQPEFAKRAEILRDKGTNRGQFLRSEVDKYTWVDVGSSYVPSEICSAFLYAQFEHLGAIAEKRRRVYERYAEDLRDYDDQDLLRLPRVPQECQGNHHMFYVLLPSQVVRDQMIAHLKEQGIQAVFHYIPLHTSPMGERLGFATGDLPVTEDISGRLLRLPMFYDLAVDDQSRVIEQIGAFLEDAAAPSGQAAH